MIAEIETTHYQFTIGDYHRMGETGIFAEDDRVELLNGQIYTMSLVGRKHVACVHRLTNLLPVKLAGRAVVSVQNPVILTNHSEPEPDVMLLKNRADFYEDGLAEADDVLLLIEVSDATLRFDKEVKLPLYAQSGIGEVWIIDLKKSCIEVYTDPQNGSYQQQQTAKRGQSLTPRQLPFLTVGVQELIG
jgi:Uma2 family endonuclease